MNEKLLSPNELAEFLGISVAHLARWRIDGNGPAFLKVGTGRQGKIRYRQSVIEEWITSREFRSTADEGTAA